MKGYKIIIALFLLLQCLNAQYWFQSGARGGVSSQFNNGASVSIQTINEGQPVSGSVAFWVGEDLQNGAFLQTGYVIENQSGRYPTYCDSSGCSQYEYITAGAPEWFYEYFPPGNSNNFLGGVGPNDSAEANGTFNNYGFYSQGSSWNFEMDGNVIGEVPLGANTSGYNDVVAFGEVANTTTDNMSISPIKFYNLSIYRFGKLIPAPTGYSYIGYGVGSLTDLTNPYGVAELGARADAFEVGSGIQEPKNDFPLWQTSFSLSVKSQYSNISSSGLYIASRTVSINAPAYVYLNNNTREAFTGWSGAGVGGYTGKSNNSVVLIYSNITETANWQLQYLVNVSSKYSTVHGTGWYPANSTIYYSTDQNLTYMGNYSRFEFEGWQNGTNIQSGTVKVMGPLKINAIWQKEYLVNASAQYGNVTGTGWYPANSTAQLSVTVPYKNENATERLSFYSWSDGNKNVSYALRVNKPINLYASYRNQYLVELYGVDVYGSKINVNNFYINNISRGNQTYLFGGEKYLVTGAMYDGAKINVSQSISTNSIGLIEITVPLYNVELSAADVFGVPVAGINVRLKFSNGTVQNVELAKGGEIIQDVPYGIIHANTRYLGLNLSTTAAYGSRAKFTVVSATDLGIFGIVIVLSFAMYFFTSRHMFNTTAIKPMHTHNQ